MTDDLASRLRAAIEAKATKATAAQRKHPAQDQAEPWQARYSTG